MGKLRSAQVEQLLSQTLDYFVSLPHARVLDIGAGQVIAKNHRAGLHELAHRYERLVATGAYIGLEIGDESKPAVVGDAHHLPFVDCCMDGVLMASVLEHLYDPLRAVDEVYRVLKPGGVLFSYAPFYFPYHASPHDYYRFTVDGYRYMLRRFSQVRLVSGGNYLAILNDIVSYPLNRGGRIGRALSRGLVELPLGVLFRRFDSRLSTDIATGFGAWARK